MRAVELASDLCRRFEGFSATPYLCPAGYWTIGYGTLCQRDTPPINEEIAELWLQRDLRKFLRHVVTELPELIVDGSDEKIAAILDWTYNLGPGNLKTSTLRRKIKAGEWDEVPDQLRRWVFGGGKKLRGLVLRREAEAALWNSK